MSRSAQSRLLVLSRWPRRIAALSCLILAGVFALQAHRPPPDAPGGSDPRPAAELTPGRGQVAMTIALADGGAGTKFIRAGDRVDLLIQPAPSANPLVGFGDTTPSPSPLNNAQGGAKGSSSPDAASTMQISQVRVLSTGTSMAPGDTGDNINRYSAKGYPVIGAQNSAPSGDTTLTVALDKPDALRLARLSQVLVLAFRGESP